jgi:hypothetical protein
MVLLDQVVQVLRGPDLCVLRQQAIGLHLAYGPVRGSIAIERDGLRRLALMPVLSTCGQLGVDAAIMSAMKPATRQNTPVTDNPLSYAGYRFPPDMISDLSVNHDVTTGPLESSTQR